MNGPTLIDIGKSFWVSFLVSAVLTYPIWRLLIRMKSRQTVSAHLESHQVKQGTPTMGGIIIAAGALAAYGCHAGGLFGTSDLMPGWSIHTPNMGLIALILFGGFALIGFVDDYLVPKLTSSKRGLGWKHKIAMQVTFAVLASFMATEWKYNPTVLTCVFLILFFSNAYNFSDGLDGLSGSLLLGIAAGLAALAWHSGFGSYLALLVVPLFAAVIPFLYLNAPPAKVFMGDVGSLPIGAVFGLVANELIWLPPTTILAGQDVPRGVMNLPMLSAVAVLSLIMVIELVPVPLQILSVKVRKKRMFPFKTPVHHALEDLGWKETRITAAFALTQLVLAILALGIFLQGDGSSAPFGGVVGR